MSDLIKREDVMLRVREFIGNKSYDELMLVNDLNALPSAEPERNIIRCADCKWWDRLEDGHPYGYCRACRSGTHTERWDISIRRQCKFDFWCADAEPNEDEDDDE